MCTYKCIKAPTGCSEIFFPVTLHLKISWPLACFIHLLVVDAYAGMSCWSLHISLRQWSLEIFVSMLKCYASLPKTNLCFSLRYSAHTNGHNALHERSINGRREKCNQILWTAILKWEGKMYKRKKQETASRLISTILHFNTFKDCTAYVTFPHCTAANMTEGWTLGCVHFNIHNVHTQKILVQFVAIL